MDNNNDPTEVEWKSPPETEVVWKSPPPEPLPRHERVAAELRTKPGEWALIARTEAWGFGRWWAPLTSSDEFEVRSVPTTERAMGPREVYARFTGGLTSPTGPA